MRFLAVLVFVSSVAAAAFVMAAPADAAWQPSRELGRGLSPVVRLDGDAEVVALARPPAGDPPELRVLRTGRPVTRVKVPRPGRLVAFGMDRGGAVIALRERRIRRRAPQRIFALVEGGWRPISSALSSAVDAKLAVADSGAALAVWLQYEGRRVYVHAAERAPGARRFGPAQRISGATSRRPQPLALAVDDDGNAVVALTERRDLWTWRPGAAKQRIHDATAKTAGAFATAAAVRGPIGLVAFTHLEDLEPPAYRAVAALQIGSGSPMVDTIAKDVSAIDVAATVDALGGPTVVTSRIGPPYALDVQRYAGAWGVTQTIAAHEPPSELALVPGALTWTELDAVYASLSYGPSTRLTDFGAGPAIALAPTGRALAAWHTTESLPARAAAFTP